MNDEVVVTPPTKTPRLGVYGSRKFIISLATLIVVSFLVYNKIISDREYSNIVIAVVAAYVTSNVAQKYATKQNSETTK